MITINIPRTGISFNVDIVYKLEKLFLCEEIIVTLVNPLGIIEDYVFTGPKFNLDESGNTLTMDFSSMEKLNVFSLVSFLVEEAKTLFDVFMSYDGDIFACTDNKLLLTHYSDLKILAKESGKIYVVTGF